MQFTRSTYPEHVGAQGSPCWQLSGKRLWADVDWNTHFPFGFDFGMNIPPHAKPGMYLTLNPPLGEPNRLSFWTSKRQVTLGLPSVRDFRETGRKPSVNGRGTEVQGEYFSNWLHPHIDGLSRYCYHQDDAGEWVRNDKPEPMHWGWLTIEKRERSYTGS